MYFIVYLFVMCQASQDDEFIYSVHFLDIYSLIKNKRRMLLNQTYCNKIPRATQCGLLSGHILSIDVPAITVHVIVCQLTFVYKGH
jgi:hypothetical protein